MTSVCSRLVLTLSASCLFTSRSPSVPLQPTPRQRLLEACLLSNLLRQLFLDFNHLQEFFSTKLSQTYSFSQLHWSTNGRLSFQISFGRSRASRLSTREYLCTSATSTIASTSAKARTDLASKYWFCAEVHLLQLFSVYLHVLNVSG